METNGLATGNGQHHDGMNGVSDLPGASPLADGSGAILNPETSEQLSIREMEILRIVGQFLMDQGFKDTYKCLVRESGIVLEHQAASRLRQHILEGQWDVAEAAISELSTLINSEDSLTEMRFLLLEQRFLEELEDQRFLDALMILRNQITPMQRNTARVHTLASCIMCRDTDELKAQADWTGKSGGSRSALVERLQRSIPPVAMLPPRRIDALMEDAVRRQINDCRYHNSSETDLRSISLLMKHSCDTVDFPTCCVQSVTHHENELWVCQFAPSGDYLATGGRDGAVTLWTVDRTTHTVTLWKVLANLAQHIRFMQWSPDSNKLAVCCGEDQSSTNVYQIATGELLCSVRVQEEDVYSSCAFFPDSRKLAFGGLKGQFYIMDTEDKGRVMVHIEGYRIQSLVCLHGNRPVGDEVLVTADTLHRVRAFRFTFQPGNAPPVTTTGLSTTPGPSVLPPEGVPHGSTLLGSSAASGGSASGTSTPTLPTAPGHGQGSLFSGAYSLAGSSDSSARPPPASDHVTSHETMFTETRPIQAVTLSKDSKFALITLHKMGLTMWDLEDRVIVARFQGVRQEQNVLLASFGGVAEDFVACGSEDGFVHIWHRSSPHPVFSLEGHRSRGPVTCVHWNPGLPTMMASVNDDGELRIWAPLRFKPPQSEEPMSE